MAKEEKKVEETKVEGEAVVVSAKDQVQVREIVKVIESKEIAPADMFGKLTRAQIELLKRTVAQGASDDELSLFIQVCKGAQLNPFLRQAHFVPFWDSKSGTEKRVIVVGIDGFRAIAEGGGQYAGNDDAVFEGEEVVMIDVWKDKKVTGQKELKVPAKATVSVWKVIGGQRYAFTASARWSEYYPGGKKGARWHSMPYLMLGKCAEALALRKAFPKLLSGLYAQEEMDQAMNEDTNEKKAVLGVVKLKQFFRKANKKEVEEWKEKVSKSEKYTEEQKVEVLAIADGRLVELDAK